MPDLTLGDRGDDGVRAGLDTVELEDAAGLQLLADRFVIDVESGTRQRVEGLPAEMEVWSAQQHGDDVIITVDCVDCPARPEVFVLRPGETAAERIATGVFVAPASQGSLWAKSYESATSCRLGRIDLDGRVLDAARPIACDVDPIADTRHGLVARVGDDVALIDPSNLTELARWAAPSGQSAMSPLQLQAIVGELLLLSEGDEFVLVDLETGDEVRIHGPDAVGFPSIGAAHPDGRHVAIEYRTPAQIMDVWLLNLDTLRWTQAPSMPVHAFIKRPGPT